MGSKIPPYLKTLALAVGCFCAGGLLMYRFMLIPLNSQRAYSDALQRQVNALAADRR